MATAVMDNINWNRDKETTELFLEKIGVGQRPLKVGYMNENNTKLNYEFVALDKVVDKESKDGETPITSIDGRRVDYPITITKEIDENIKPKLAFTPDKKYGDGLPLSFLGINDGEVDKGKEWYLRNDPKLPDDIAELMARYSFGDLKNLTKKEAKNKRKKLAKKGTTIYEDQKLGVKKGEFVIEFN